MLNSFANSFTWYYPETINLLIHLQFGNKRRQPGFDWDSVQVWKFLLQSYPGLRAESRVNAWNYHPASSTTRSWIAGSGLGSDD